MPITEAYFDGMPADVVDLARLARRFFENEAVPHRRSWAEERRVPREFWRSAGQVGLLCAAAPAEYGGGGGDERHDLVILQEQARVGEFGFGNHVHSGVVARYLTAYGSAEQKARWLPGMASGEVVAAIALTEPEAGSDLRALRTTAVRDGAGYRLSGSKTFVTNGACADLVLVAASTKPSAGVRGISLFLVDAGACEGFRRGRTLEKIGQASGDTAELFFDDARVPADALLRAENAGFAMMFDQLPWERLIIGAMAVAATERAVEITIAYAKGRNAYDGTLFDLQSVRHELAECATLSRVGRAFLDDCVRRLMKGELDPQTASMAKYWLTDVQCQVIDRCLQLHGANGYSADYDIGPMYVDARAQRIYGGANEVMKDLIASML